MLFLITIILNDEIETTSIIKEIKLYLIFIPFLFAIEQRRIMFETNIIIQTIVNKETIMPPSYLILYSKPNMQLINLIKLSLINAKGNI